ncbi:TMEM175 family protein [Alteromonas facilis]|uniref:TMEM175 family protein n=1 Tax=Alteromonas facilis TaxID=2048004 RepID=UPI000C2829D9|nr:TMEM175 family protein [Alteromonas facilis]
MQTKQRGNAEAIYRGQTMDRLETFVAAALAFAVTMLVISVDNVPTSFDEFIYAAKLIPSFAASFSVVVWIWASHANWCRRYGLEDTAAIVLSAFLVFVVLVYIYPLRAMMQGLFSVLSGGYLPHELSYSSSSEVRFTFQFFAVGFLLLGINFIALYVHALRAHYDKALSSYERFSIYGEVQAWTIVACVSGASFALATLLPIHKVGYAGYAFFLLFPLLWIHGAIRKKRNPV